MKRNYILLSLIVALMLYCFAFKSTNNIAGPAITPAEQTGVIVKATTTFLNSLNTDQREKTLFDFAPQKAATAAKFQRTGNPGGQQPGTGNKSDQLPAGGPPKEGSRGGQGKGQFAGFIGEQYGKAVWSNFPVSDVSRPGLQLGSLTSIQLEAAMNMLRELLSPQGYAKVLEIMGSDQVLSESGTNYASGKDRYTLAIFGTPNMSTPWMVQFGGHHLALNIVIAGSQGALTPTLTGAQPAVYQSNGKTVRVLAAENDKAFSLLEALDGAQRKKAILNYEVGDLVLGPGHDGEVIVPEGLKASAMTAKQKAILIDLISQWAGIINDAYVKARMEEINAGIDDTYFA